MRRGIYLALRRWRNANGPVPQDVKDFLLAYSACFLAIMTFIS